MFCFPVSERQCVWLTSYLSFNSESSFNQDPYRFQAPEDKHQVFFVHKKHDLELAHFSNLFEMIVVSPKMNFPTNCSGYLVFENWEDLLVKIVKAEVGLTFVVILLELGSSSFFSVSNSEKPCPHFEECYQVVGRSSYEEEIRKRGEDGLIINKEISKLKTK